VNRAEVLILQALRAGPIDRQSLMERILGADSGIHALRVSGLIESADKKLGLYRLTPAGRAACPPRNPASALPRVAPVQGPRVRSAGRQPNDPGKIRGAAWTL
jgi:hypothetical protein